MHLLAVLAGCASGGGPPVATDVEDLLPLPTECEGAPPTYTADPNWPPLLPNGWSLATVGGIAVDQDDNVWVIHRSGVNTADGGVPSAGTGPPVIQFDPNGNVIQGWGGPGDGYDWPDTEHGIGLDADGNVWVSGNGANDHMLLKFTPEGEFLLQIGGRGVSEGSNDVDSVGRPADIVGDDREIFVADGYGNKRVIVFDLNGTYQRHWGAFGNVPEDGGPTSEQFGGPVHGIDLAANGDILVGDRDQGRVHYFMRDGTFIREFPVPPASVGDPTAFDVAFIGPEEDYFAIADAWLATGNDRIVIMCRWSGDMVGEIYAGVHEAVGGPGPPLVASGRATITHMMTADSQGNLYVGDGYGGGTGGQVHKLVRGT